MEQNGVEVTVQQSSEFMGKQEVSNEINNSMQEGQVEEDGDTTLATIKKDVNDEEGGGSEKVGMEFDSTDVFNAVFGTKREFDSWDEYTDYLEEFQSKSGTRFKARSACRVDHVNERRIGSPIPERFVYAAIKMICVHYGEGGGSGRRKNYVGKGCDAMMRVSYSKGAMRITQTHLIHNNHDLIHEENHPSTRNFRVFNFTEELDLLIVKEVLKTNPFEFKNGEKEWSQAVDNLKSCDERFSSLTLRLIKKRTRLLLDNFRSISQGKKPAADDELGSMLFKLDQIKEQNSEETIALPKPRKRRGRGRPRKDAVKSEDEDEFYDIDDDELVSYSPAKKPKLKQTPSSTPVRAVASGDMSMSKLLTYLQKKDEEDRKLRRREIEEDKQARRREMEEDRKLRQKEIDMRRDELTFQKERFEFEKTERKVHLDLLKSQLQVFEQNMMMKHPQQHPAQSQPQALMPMTITTLPHQPHPQPQSLQQPQQQARDIRPQTDYNQFHYR